MTKFDKSITQSRQRQFFDLWTNKNTITFFETLFQNRIVFFSDAVVLNEDYPSTSNPILRAVPST